MTELVLHERITTTEEKAKSIRSRVEKLITKAKRKGQQAEYLLQPYLSAQAVEKLIVDISPRFSTRPGGYTRLIKLGNRFSDNASMAVIELVEKRKSLSTVEAKDGEEIEPEQTQTDGIIEAEIVSEKPEKKVSKKTKEVKEKKTVKKKGESEVKQS